MGLIASIHKDAKWAREGTDCSNNGLSNRYDEVTIVNAEGPFEPTEDRPAVAIVQGHMDRTVHAVPIDEETEPNAGRRGMMGGTYIATSDSRFSDLIEAIIGTRFYGAVPFHDRYEP